MPELPTDNRAPGLAIRCFGTFEVRIDGKRMERPRTQKGSRLLALLILHHDRDTERNSLARLFWSHCSAGRCRSNLKVALRNLRDCLGPAHDHRLPRSRVTLRIDLDGADVDLLAFDAAIRRGDANALREAVALYRGPLLEGWTEAWVVAERARREEQYLDALERLAEGARTGDDVATAIDYLRRVVARSPTRLAACRSLKRLELDGALRRGEPDARSSGRLPRSLTPLVGRKTEIVEVKERLLAPDTTLVTLTGTGGIGKTRLARRIAEELQSAFPDGVTFVALESLADPTLVPQAVAAALELDGSDEVPSETLRRHLSPKQLLLVLDNCEHLLPGCAELAEGLLQHCPGLRILTTSREPLRAAGEMLYDVPPLSVPAITCHGTDTNHRLAALAESEAVRLFVARAQAADRRFALDEENAETVARICRALDGVPLALELAAARVHDLFVHGIVAGLANPLRLLTQGRRTAALRQTSLRATLDWSYGLLSRPARLLLARVSVFAGGFTAEAAWAVCGDRGLAWAMRDGETEDTHDRSDESDLRSVSSACSWNTSEGNGADIVNVLEELVSKAVVVAEKGNAGYPRYRLLETIRQYGLEKLIASSGAEEVWHRYRDVFMAFAEREAHRLCETTPIEALNRLQSEHDNLRAVLRRAIDEQDAGTSFRIASALHRFWYVRGHWSEGRRRWSEILALGGFGIPAEAAPQENTHLRNGRLPSGTNRDWTGATRAPQHICAEALLYLAELCDAQSDRTAARDCYERGLTLLRRLHNQGRVAAALQQYGLFGVRDDYETSKALMVESLEISHSLGDGRASASTLDALAAVSRYHGHLEDAREFQLQSLAIRRERGDRPGIADSLRSLAKLAHTQEGTDSARTLLEQSLIIERELGRAEGVAESLERLANVARDRFELHRAMDLYREAATAWRTVGDPRRIASALLGHGHTAWIACDYATALTTLSECLNIRRDLGDQGGVAFALSQLALVARDTGDLSTARARFEECLGIWQRVEDDAAIADCLTGLSGLRECPPDPIASQTAHSGWDRSVDGRRWRIVRTTIPDPRLAAERAALLWGAAEELRDARRIPRLTQTRPWLRAVLAAFGLESEAFDTAWAAGAAMSKEEVIAFALQAITAG